MPGRAAAAHTGGDLLRELEHLPVEQEEAGEVDLEPRGELDRAGDGVEIVGKPLRHRLRRREDALVVATPLALAALERGAGADRDEHVLERGAARMVRVDVAGGHSRDVERLS